MATIGEVLQFAQRCRTDRISSARDHAFPLLLGIKVLKDQIGFDNGVPAGQLERLPPETPLTEGTNIMFETTKEMAVQMFGFVL